MPVEQAQYINTLQPDWPLGTEPENGGDDHLRMIKQVLQNTFPNISDAVKGTPEDINNLTYGMRYNVIGTDPNDVSRWASETPDGTYQVIPHQAATISVAQGNYNPQLLINFQALVNLVYPVGAVFESWSDSRNPAEILGFGTWLQLVGFAAAVGPVADGNGMSVTFGAGFNGGVGDWLIDHSAIRPGGYTVQVSGTADEQGGHYHGNGIQNPDNYANGGGYYGTQPVTNHGGGWAEGGSGTASESLTSTNGEHGHNVTASGTVTIGSGQGAHLPPFHTTYRWVRTA